MAENHIAMHNYAQFMQDYPLTGYHTAQLNVSCHNNIQKAVKRVVFFEKNVLTKSMVHNLCIKLSTQINQNYLTWLIAHTHGKDTTLFNLILDEMFVRMFEQCLDWVSVSICLYLININSLNSLILYFVCCIVCIFSCLIKLLTV